MFGRKRVLSSSKTTFPTIPVRPVGNIACAFVLKGEKREAV